MMYPPTNLFKYIDSSIFRDYDIRHKKQFKTKMNFYHPKFVNLEKRPPTLVYKKPKRKNRTKVRKL